MKENLIKLLTEEFGHLPECIDMDRLTWDWYDYIEIRLNNWEEHEYRVIPASIIEDIFYDSIKELVEDSYLWSSDLPYWIKNNIDWDSIVSECKYDWYGHHFNGYDWSEIEGNWLYLFRN